MNYGSIYSKFIESRRERQLSKDDFVERHHIIPRCMNGSDDDSNMISLTPEDHFFAHLLLAKTYDTRPLWGALVLMASNIENASWPYSKKHRVGFGIARRRFFELNRGNTHPRADLTGYIFYHMDGEKFKGTRIDFEREKLVPPASVNAMILGLITHCCGWSISPINKSEYLAARSETSRKNGKNLKGFIRDKKKYTFFNRDLNLEVSSTQSEMVSLGYLSKNAVSALVNGKRLLSNGWVLSEKKDFAYDAAFKIGAYGVNYNSNQYDFVNDELGITRTTTIWDMGRKFNNGDGRPFGEVASGRRKSFRGWRLSITDPRKVRTLNKIHIFKHPINGTVACTQSDLAKKYNIHPVLVSRTVRGLVRSTNGWVVVK